MTVQEEAKKYFDMAIECYENYNFVEPLEHFRKVMAIDPNFYYKYYSNIDCEMFFILQSMMDLFG